MSYTFFLTQVSSHNVGLVTATGDTIQGTFKHQVTYPPGATGAAPVLQFTTQRPSFADDHLFQRLQASGVTVNAEPPSQGTPLWEELLLWFGPALLLGGLFTWWMRSGRLGGLGAMGGFGQSRAHRYDPVAANRTTFADVAGIEDVKDEVTEIVDFLRDPGPVPPAGGADPARRAAVRPARHRQDAPGQSGRRRGGRAVLLDLGVGVRRDDRRGRGQPGA